MSRDQLSRLGANDRAVAIRQPEMYQPLHEDVAIQSAVSWVDAIA